jgi:phage baseplate assembly protein W
MGFEVHPDTGDLFRFTNENAVKKSLRNLIFTDKYERVFKPDIGCNVRSMLFSNMTPESLIAIKDTIRETIDKYEPRVAIQEIQVVADPDKNGVVINMIFQILNIPQTQFLSITIDRAR